MLLRLLSSRKWIHFSHRPRTYRQLIDDARHAALEEVLQRQIELGDTAEHVRLALGVRVALHALQVDLRRCLDRLHVGQHDVDGHLVLGAVDLVVAWAGCESIQFINHRNAEI